MNKQYIPSLIMHARKRADLPSDYALAKQIGVSQSAVTGWRHGRTLPVGGAAVQLAEAAGVDPGALILWSMAHQTITRWPGSGRRAVTLLQKVLPKSALVPHRSGLQPWS